MEQGMWVGGVGVCARELSLFYFEIMFLWCCGSSSGSPAVALRLGEIVSRGSALYA